MSEATTSSGGGSSFFGMPLAIVIAGALIAGAIYYSGTNQGAAPIGGGAAGDGGGNQPVAGDFEAPEPVEPAIGDFRPVDSDDHIRGAANAKVTVIEYSDIECPFCKRFHPTMEQLVEEFPNDVRWVYRHFPLEQIHPNARMAAIATECAAEQGRFWELTDYLFNETTSGADLAQSKLSEHAQAAGVPNAGQFQTCLDSGKYEDKIDAHLVDAQAAGGQGTPYSVIVGPDGETAPLSGAQPYAAVKAAVENYL